MVEGTATEKPDDIEVRNSPPFRLKDKPNRQFQAINLKKQFGFTPDVIIIEKLKGKNNALFVRAVLTEEGKKLHDDMMKAMMVKK